MALGVFGFCFEKSSRFEKEEKIKWFQKNCLEKRGVFLQTCNRVEFYFGRETFFCIKELHDKNPYFSSSNYLFIGKEAFSHLCKVTSGLNSPLIGETEIKRQVKEAYLKAKNPSSSLHYFFQKAFHIAKRIKTEFLPEQIPQIGNILFHILKKPELSTSFSFLGNSTLNRQLIRYFSQLGFSSLSLFSKFTEGEIHLGKKSFFIEKWDVQKAFQKDVVILASKLEKPICFEEELPKEKPVFDLGEPPNLDSSFSHFMQVYNLNDIYQFWKKKGSEIEKSKKKGEELITEKSLKYYQAYEVKQYSSISFSA